MNCKVQKKNKLLLSLSHQFMPSQIKVDLETKSVGGTSPLKHSESDSDHEVRPVYRVLRACGEV